MVKADNTDDGEIVCAERGVDAERGVYVWRKYSDDIFFEATTFVAHAPPMLYRKSVLKLVPGGGVVLSVIVRKNVRTIFPLDNVFKAGFLVVETILVCFIASYSYRCCVQLCP